MDRSVSVIVIAHNVESKLQSQIQGLLEALPELATSFEIVIIDDGSTDETHCVARELGRQYPQIRVLRRPMRYGETAAIGLACQSAIGEVLVIFDATDAPPRFHVHQLRFQRQRPDTVMESPARQVELHQPHGNSPRRMKVVPKLTAQSPHAAFPRVIDRALLPKGSQAEEREQALAVERSLRNHFRRARDQHEPYDK